ncbi:MAG: hypothetical protein JRG94_19275 [Deltaproteobacteria bacterium]|nr:hypothetical protein [Deltaproteobacteria bacterium]
MASRFVAALTVLLIFSFAGCRTPVGEAPAPITGVDPSDLELIRELRQLDAQIKFLDQSLGSYPASFESEEEREEVHTRWAPQAASAAYNSLNRCIALASGHVECHYNLARLFLASSPRFAANAERLLIRVRSLIAPEIRPEFEFALAKAYLRQGRRSAALRQIDYYLSFEPRDVDAQRFRNSLVSDAEGEMQRKRSRTLTPSRAAEQ